MRSNTPWLDCLNCSLGYYSSRSDPLGGFLRKEYPPYYGTVPYNSLGSQSHPETRQELYLWLWKVRSRIRNGAEGFSARAGDLNTSPPYASVHRRPPSATESLRIALASSLREKLVWKIAAQRLLSITTEHPARPECAGVGCPGIDGTLRLLGFSSLSWSGEGILQEPV